MATAASAKGAPKETVFEWEGKDRNGKGVKGETRAAGENQVRAALRRQGITPTKLKKRRMSGARAVKPKDISIFTRQLATMMKAGVPLLQAFDIVGRGNPNPGVTKLLNDVRSDVETGTSLSSAFRKYPMYFDNLYCNLVEAGEQAGILDQLLDRLAVYLEKTEAIKSKIKSALMYPIAVLVTAFVVVAVIMIFVIPSFKEVFTSFGADLPAPTLVVIAMSEFFVSYWWAIFGGIGGGFYFFMQAWKRNERVQQFMDRLMLKLPIFGALVEKSCIARWTRTLATMFAAGVPLVEALDSVGGASGNYVYQSATMKIQQEVSTGTALTAAMTNANLFPSMVLQMCAIGEESGSIDHMLGKAADFYEAEVDDMVAAFQPDGAHHHRRAGYGDRRHRGLDVPAHLQNRPGRLMPVADALGIALFGVFGLVIGSFLNVVIYRLPKMLEAAWAAEGAAAAAAHVNTHLSGAGGSGVAHSTHSALSAGGTDSAALPEGKPFNLMGSALALRALRARDSLVRKHPRRKLPCFERPLLGVQRRDWRALPLGRVAHGWLICGMRLQVRGTSAHPGLVRVCRRPGGADLHRLGHHAAARRHHPASGLVRSGLFRAALDSSEPARSRVGRDRGLSVALVRLLGVQDRHRQRGHGLRRLQALCGHGRMVWLAGAGADDPHGFGHWCRGGHRHEAHAEFA